MQAPELRDDGSLSTLVLRLPTEADAGDVAAASTDPDLLRWCHDAPDPLDLDAARALVAAAAAGWTDERTFTLTVELDGAWAGWAALRPDGRGGADLSCALAPWARGRRAGSRAVRLLLEWGFAQRGFQVVHAVAEVGHWRWRRLAWSCGFTVDAAVRGLVTTRDGERRDGWIASLRWGEPLRPASRWLVPVPLSGHGVTLGAHRPRDVDRVAQACSAASTQTWLPSLPSPYTVLDAAAYVASREEAQASGTGVSWAVRGHGEDLLATVSLFRLEPGSRSAEVGYWAHPDSRGRGVVSAAVRLVAGHGLSSVASGGLGLERLDLKAAATNHASRRVAAKAGFTQVGLERDGERLRDGSVVDFVRYDLLASELAPGP